MLVVLLETRRDVAALDVATVNQLAGLGVTHITIARDQATEAVVLEGWAFDVSACGAEASALVSGRAANRLLQPVLRTLITAEREPEGGTRDPTPPSTPCTTTRSSAKGSS